MQSPLNTRDNAYNRGGMILPNVKASMPANLAAPAGPVMNTERRLADLINVRFLFCHFLKTIFFWMPVLNFKAQLFLEKKQNKNAFCDPWKSREYRTGFFWLLHV